MWRKHVSEYIKICNNLCKFLSHTEIIFYTAYEYYICETMKNRLEGHTLNL